MFKTILLIGTGGFVGSVLRYFTQMYVHSLFNSMYPWGTFVVNVLGSFIIGIAFALAAKTNLISIEMRNFIVIGLCGGFTTFSTFSVDGYNMINGGNIMWLGLYTMGSVVSGIFAVMLGVAIVKLAM